MNEAWATRDEVADHLGVDVATVDYWVRNHDMPSVKLGAAKRSPRRFRLSEVDQWVRDFQPREAPDAA